MILKAPLALLQKVSPASIPSYYQRDKPTKDYNPIIDVSDAHNLPKHIIAEIKKWAAENDRLPVWQGRVPSALNLIRKIERYQEQPDAGARTVTDLDDLLPSLRDVVDQTSPVRHWIYREMGDGIISPAYVSEIELKRRRGRDEPARVVMTLVYVQRSNVQKMTVSFFRSSISPLLDDCGVVGVGSKEEESEGMFAISTTEEDDNEDSDGESQKKRKQPKTRKIKRTLKEILAAHRLSLETERLYEDYKRAVPLYNSFQGLCGVTVRGEGRAFYVKTFKNRWSEDDDSQSWTRDLDEEGTLAELVLDDDNREKVKFKLTYDFWHYDRGDRDEETYTPPKFWDRGQCSIPFHPYVLAFDLHRHQHVWVHATCLKPREHQTNILDNLVLHDKDKDFLSVLMGATEMRMEDIIHGKSGGVFILSEGPPGTGKTLTAEIYSEAMKKPLYTVQCSQLGISPDDIEEKLKKVLDRSQRWQAVLLLDEADVYIRSRGKDVHHNAIVGVMLRVIEYYSGLLFMTTNLHDIDDAVLSRATAHIIYTRPGQVLLKRLWEVLSKQFGVALSADEMAKLAALWPAAVGRDVKNLVKLARLATAKNNEKPGYKTILGVSSYLDMESKKKLED